MSRSEKEIRDYYTRLGTIIDDNKKSVLTVKNTWFHSVARNDYMAMAVGVTNDQKSVAFATRDGKNWEALVGEFVNYTKGLILVKYDSFGFTVTGQSIYNKALLRFQTNDGQTWSRRGSIQLT